MKIEQIKERLKTIIDDTNDTLSMPEVVQMSFDIIAQYSMKEKELNSTIYDIAELKAHSKLIEATGLELLNIDEIEDAEDIATIHSNFNDALRLTPKHCLTEHDKAVKCQAFIDGVNFANHSDRSNHAVHVNQKASEYSESI